MTITSYIHQMVKEHAVEKIWCFLSFSWIYCTFKMSKGVSFYVLFLWRRAPVEITLIAIWFITGKQTKVHIDKAVVYPVALYGCESWIIKKVKSESEVTQSCPTLCDPMDCSLPGSSVHGIFQARVLEWVAISFSRGSSQLRDRTGPRDQTQVSRTAGRCFTIWATREADHKESWVPNWCFQTVVLEKTRESLGMQGNQTSQS